MNYVILDNNRFYAEGLRYALLRRNAQMLVESGAVTWRHSLLACDTLVVRCRFSVAGTHQALVEILLQLEASRWKERFIWCAMKKAGRWPRICESVLPR